MFNISRAYLSKIPLTPPARVPLKFLKEISEKQCLENGKSDLDYNG
jgi:hypothetical protein